jgi:branched-chain amino acid transport system permease protein
MDFINGLVVLMNFVLIPATAYGAQLALGALGVTLIYGILRFSNFAHGDTMAFGTMITVLVTWWLQSMGISFGPPSHRTFGPALWNCGHGSTIAVN